MIRLAIRVARERAELALADLLELAPAGVEERELSDGSVEYAVYGAPGELPGLPDLHALAGGEMVHVSTSEVPDDWSERWKRFHRPVSVAPPAASALPTLRVRPPWEPATPTPAAGARAMLEIEIDPGQAFGTGAHASTRLCLELLLALATAESVRGPLLDLGTGSGVLAIAAAMLGYRPVRGYDNDPLSVHAARENAAVNAVAIEVERLDLRSDPIALRAGEILTANLLRPLLIVLAQRLERAPRHLIAGGLLDSEADEIAAAFAALGMDERERRREGEWAALWLSAAVEPASPG